MSGRVTIPRWLYLLPLLMPLTQCASGGCAGDDQHPPGVVAGAGGQGAGNMPSGGHAGGTVVDGSDGGGAAGAGFGGTAGEGGAPTVWQSFTTLGSCTLERSTGGALLRWEPCGWAADCEVAELATEGLGSGKARVTNHSALLDFAKPQFALTFAVGGTTYAGFVADDGEAVEIFRAAAKSQCTVVGAGSTPSEHAVVVTIPLPTGGSRYAIARSELDSGGSRSFREVDGLHDYAILTLKPNKLDDQRWVVNQVAGDVWAIDEDNTARELLAKPGTGVLGRSRPVVLPDRRIVVAELRVAGATTFWATSLLEEASGQLTDLLGVVGENWASPRWTGSGLAVVRGYGASGDSLSRTEVWAGPFGAGVNQFAPITLGSLVNSGTALADLGDLAVGGHDYYVTALAPTDAIRDLAIWNISTHRRSDVHVASSGGLFGFLGITPEFVYLLAGEDTIANRIIRIRLERE